MGPGPLDANALLRETTLEPRKGAMDINVSDEIARYGVFLGNFGPCGG